MDGKRRKADLLLFITAFIWGIAFVAQKSGMRYVQAFTFGAARFALGAVSMLPLLLAARHREKQAEKKQEGKLIPAGLMLGVVLFAATTLQQIGICTTTAGKAGFITDLYIIIVPLIETFAGRRQGKTIWICAFMAAAGLYLIGVSGNFTVSPGDIMVLSSSFLWAVQILMVDKFSKSYDPVKLSFIQYCVTAVLSIPPALLFEKISITGLYGAALPIVYAGVFSVGIAYTFQIAGQRYAKASHAAIIMSMESVISLIAGAVMLHESISAREITGCALMGAAMILTQISPPGKEKQTAEV